jgi:hypothetical protein
VTCSPAAIGSRHDSPSIAPGEEILAYFDEIIEQDGLSEYIPP